MTIDIEEEEVEVVDVDMGDAAKENLRRQHMHLYNHNVFICKTSFVMSIFVHSYVYGVGQNKVTTLQPYVPSYSVSGP
jgi:hypothetical protein